MNHRDIVQCICEAIKHLTLEERPLQPDVHERSFAHRLALHMEPLFEGWDIDCEYNKHGMTRKELEGIKACDEQRKTNRIYPDILVHKRTNNSSAEENLLVIELKLNDECDACDKKKLELLTKQDGEYRYPLGLYINIKNLKFVRTWYRDGGRVDEDVLIDK